MSHLSIETLNLVYRILDKVGINYNKNDEPSEVMIDKLEIDSLSMMEIAMFIEEEVGIEIPLNQLREVKNLAELAKIIDQQRAL